MRNRLLPQKKLPFLLLMLVYCVEHGRAQFPPGTLSASGYPLTGAHMAASPALGAFPLNQAVASGLSASTLQALPGLQALPTASLQNLQSLQQLQALQGVQGLQSIQGLQGIGAVATAQAAAPQLGLTASGMGSPFMAANTTFIPLGQVLIPTGKEVIRGGNNNGGGGDCYGNNCGGCGNFYATNSCGGGGGGSNCGGFGGGYCSGNGDCSEACCGPDCCGDCGGGSFCGGGRGGVGYGMGRRRRRRSIDLLASLFNLIQKRIAQKMNRRTRYKSSKDGFYN